MDGWMEVSPFFEVKYGALNIKKQKLSTCNTNVKITTNFTSCRREAAGLCLSVVSFNSTLSLTRLQIYQCVILFCSFRRDGRLIYTKSKLAVINILRTYQSVDNSTPVI